MDDPKLLGFIAAAVAGAVTALFAWFKTRADRRVASREKLEEIAATSEHDLRRTLTADHADLRRELREDVDRFRVRLDSLQHQLDAALELNRELRVRMAEQGEELATLRVQRERMTAEIVETRTELDLARKRERVMAADLDEMHRILATGRSSLRPPPKR